MELVESGLASQTLLPTLGFTGYDDPGIPMLNLRALAWKLETYNFQFCRTTTTITTATIIQTSLNVCCEPVSLTIRSTLIWLIISICPFKMPTTSIHVTVCWCQISCWRVKLWYYHIILSKISSSWSNWILPSENTEFRII